MVKIFNLNQTSIKSLAEYNVCLVANAKLQHYIVSLFMDVEKMNKWGQVKKLLKSW